MKEEQLETMSDDKVLVCPLEDLQPGKSLKLRLGDVDVALVRDSAGDVFAIGDRCSHGDISLSEGFVEDCEIECWAHGAKFDLKSGWPTTLPAYEPVPVFETEIRDGDIYVSAQGALLPKPE